MRRRLALAALAAFGLFSGRVFADDEWFMPKPLGGGKGETVTLKRDVKDAATSPRARIRTHQANTWKDKSIASSVDFDAAAVPGQPDDKKRPTFDLALEFGLLTTKGEDVAPRLRAGGVKVSVRAAVDEKGFVAGGTTSGAEKLGAVGTFVRPAGTWVLPPLPQKPVKVGDTWDLPIPYFLWSINQMGAVPADGFVTQVLEALEDHGGVRCARIRTAISLSRPQPAGMTPPAVEIGDGAALARFRGEGVTWIGLDGCLREDMLDVRMRLENVATKAWMEWTFRRETVAQPESAGALPKDWARMMGNLPFAVGIEAGLAEAKFEGKALMCWIVKYGDPVAEDTAATVLRDKATIAKWSGYVPVIIDADAPGAFAHKTLAPGMATLLFIDPADDSEIFTLMLNGGDIELIRSAAETPMSRAPEAKPSPEFAALHKQYDILAAALPKKEWKAAVAAVLAIQKIGRGVAVQQQVRLAEIALTSAGAERIDAARAMAAGGKGKEARAALDAVAADYAGHPIAKRAADAIAGLPPPKTK